MEQYSVWNQEFFNTKFLCRKCVSMDDQLIKHSQNISFLVCPHRHSTAFHKQINVYVNLQYHFFFSLLGFFCHYLLHDHTVYISSLLNVHNVYICHICMRASWKIGRTKWATLFKQRSYLLYFYFNTKNKTKSCLPTQHENSGSINSKQICF